MKKNGGDPKSYEVPNTFGKGTSASAALWRTKDPEDCTVVWGRPHTLPSKCPRSDIAFTCLLCSETPQYVVKVCAHMYMHNCRWPVSFMLLR